MERYSRVAGRPGRRRRDPWVALYQGRNTTLDRISTRPLLKQILAKLPATAVAGPPEPPPRQPAARLTRVIGGAGTLEAQPLDPEE